MVSLKEIKGRIASVGNTCKLTSAMKRVASAKLHKAEGVIEQLWPYQQEMQRLLVRLLQMQAADGQAGDFDSPYIRRREVRRVAVVAFASNGSLCGGFNANVLRRLNEVLEAYRPLGRDHLQLYVIGRKVADEVRKMGYPLAAVRPTSSFSVSLDALADKPSYEGAAALAAQLSDDFLHGFIDRVELVYPHFQSTASQPLLHETYLPMSLSLDDVRSQPTSSSSQGDDRTRPATTTTSSSSSSLLDYLVEPSLGELLADLLPKVLRLKLYTVLLDSRTAEHAARTLAMQTATDNANDLLQELTRQYHKSRQQAITNELLDIMGGSMA